jgi:hypothetical protein
MTSPERLPSSSRQRRRPLNLVRPIATLEECHENLLHNAPLIQYTSIKILHISAVLMHSTRGMLA